MDFFRFFCWKKSLRNCYPTQHHPKPLPKGEESDKSPINKPTKLQPPQTGTLNFRSTRSPGAARRRRANAVPQPFRGFMAQRRGVAEVQLPELPEVPVSLGEENAWKGTNCGEVVGGYMYIIYLYL